MNIQPWSGSRQTEGEATERRPPVSPWLLLDLTKAENILTVPAVFPLLMEFKEQQSLGLGGGGNFSRERRQEKEGEEREGEEECDERKNASSDWQ